MMLSTISPTGTSHWGGAFVLRRAERLLLGKVGDAGGHFKHGPSLTMPSATAIGGAGAGISESGANGGGHWKISLGGHEVMTAVKLDPSRRLILDAPRQLQGRTQACSVAADGDHAVVQIEPAQTIPRAVSAWHRILPKRQHIVMDSEKGTLALVGPRLRALRQQRETSLAELSAATGISVSTLSRLESGNRRPNLELLLPIARAHRVPLDELVGGAETGDPRIHAHPFTRNGKHFCP